jgi:hypothetical protein
MSRFEMRTHPRFSRAARKLCFTAALAVPVLWSVAAPYLCAHKLISASQEFASYLLCLAASICCIAAPLADRRSQPTGNPILACCAGAVAAVLVLLLAFHSTQAFFAWKTRATSSRDWACMAADLQSVAEASLASGTNYLSGSKAPPVSLQELGVGGDYMGGAAHHVERPNYKGTVAEIEFGNKLRVWGLFCGPEILLHEFCPKCKYVSIQQHVFFYVGSRG